MTKLPFKEGKDFIQAEKIVPPVCINCGKFMKNVIDPKTKKKSKYLWKCKCYPNAILSVG